MDKIYITNNLFNFSTKIFPENTLIFNIQKFDNNELLKKFINNSNIKTIICENNNCLKTSQKLFPNLSITTIDNYNKTTHVYTDKSIHFFLYYILLSSITTFFLLNVLTREYSSIIFFTLLINFLLWISIYHLLVKKQPWQPLSTHN